MQKFLISYHIIRGTGVTHICLGMLQKRLILRSVLATKMRQASTENNIKHTKHIRAIRNSAEGLPNNVCEISALTKVSEHSEKEAAF